MLLMGSLISHLANLKQLIAELHAPCCLTIKLKQECFLTSHCKSRQLHASKKPNPEILWDTYKYTHIKNWKKDKKFKYNTEPEQKEERTKKKQKQFNKKENENKKKK
jgi:hypothetical protein